MENQDSFIWSSLPNTHRVLTQHGNIIGLTGPLYWTRLEGPALSVARSFKVPFIIKNWMAFLCIVNGCLPSFLFSKQPIFALHFYFLPFSLCVCIWGFRGQCQVFSSVIFNIIFLRQMSPQTWSLFWLGSLAGGGPRPPWSITTLQYHYNAGLVATECHTWCFSIFSMGLRPLCLITPLRDHPTIIFVFKKHFCL